MRFSKSTQSFYPEEIDYPNPPADMISVTQNDYEKAIRRASGETLDFINGKLQIIPSPEPTIEELFSSKLSEINAQASKLSAQLKLGIPDDEAASWWKQEIEARSFIANAKAPTPMLSVLSNIRGILITDLAKKIIDKADKFVALQGQIIGKRQALEDQLNNIDLSSKTAANQIAAITWSISD